MATDGASSSFTFPGSDINGDGHGDILWRNTLTGETAAWQMIGSTRALTSYNPIVSSSWDHAGLADFNSDGNSDLLWRNASTGEVAIWYLDTAGKFVSSQILPQIVSSDWRLVGVGDFNSDQKTDLLWSNATSGSLMVWYMDGANQTSSEIYGNVPLDWQVGGVGDFNSDGHDDILWHNQATGNIALWYMNGVNIQSRVAEILSRSDNTPWQVQSPWQIRGTGDFNNDGHTDIFWWNRQTGSLASWQMEGATRKEGVVLATIDTSWQPLSQARGGKADFTVNNAVVPTSPVSDGGTVNISIDVANQGSKTSQASTLKYYLSEDDTFDASSDRLLGEISTKALLAGESVALQGSFTYNASTMGASGTKYIFFAADANGVVNESNEQNNFLSQTINVVPPTPLDVDLALENVVIPSAWAVGSELTLSVDVVNQGSDGVGSSSLYVYLLDSDTFDPTGASPILTRTLDPLGAESSTTETFTFNYLEGYGTGQKYLYFVADANDLFSETDETNNVVSRSVNVSSIAQSIDFTITNVTAPSTVTLEQPMALSVTVLNQGQTSAGATAVGVYLSDYTGPNDQLDISKATFVTALSVPALNNGAASTVSADVPYSRFYEEGLKNIFFVVDYQGQVTELDETNNVMKRMIDVIPPDTSVDLFVSNFTLSSTSILPGGSLDITATVQNLGEEPTGGSTLFRIYISDDAVLDDDDTFVSGTSIGNLAAGASSPTISTSYTLPSDASAGVKYVFFQADVNNAVFELNETNNITSSPFTVREVQPGVDLLVSNASVSKTTLVAGESLTVNATVQNQGDTTASNSKLAIYVSTDANFDGSDRLIAEFNTGNIPTYDTFSQSYTFDYLDEYGLDAQYILVVADYLNESPESNEANNVQAFAINVLPDVDRPDLLMNSVEVFDADLEVGIDFNYTVKNEGEREITQDFTIRFYLSNQNYTTLADIEDNALLLGETEVLSTEAELGIGTSYNALVGFTTEQFDSSNSLWGAGERYVLAVVDYGKDILESDESNNIYSLAYTLS